MVILLYCLLVAGVPESFSGRIYFKRLPDGSYVFTDTPDSGRWLMWKTGKVKKTYPKKVIYSLICRVAKETGLDAALLRAVVELESGYDVYAVSPKGALGLMQIMPEKAVELGLRDPFNPYENLYFGAKYLKFLIQKYGMLKLALSAYHAGENAVAYYRTIPPYPSTAKYVKKILKKYTKFRIIKIKHPERLCGG